MREFSKVSMDLMAPVVLINQMEVQEKHSRVAPDKMEVPEDLNKGTLDQMEMQGEHSQVTIDPTEEAGQPNRVTAGPMKVPEELKVTIGQLVELEVLRRVL